MRWVAIPRKGFYCSRVCHFTPFSISLVTVQGGLSVHCSIGFLIRLFVINHLVDRETIPEVRGKSILCWFTELALFSIIYAGFMKGVCNE